MEKESWVTIITISIILLFATAIFGTLIKAELNEKKTEKECEQRYQQPIKIIYEQNYKICTWVDEEGNLVKKYYQEEKG